MLNCTAWLLIARFCRTRAQTLRFAFGSVRWRLGLGLAMALLPSISAGARRGLPCAASPCCLALPTTVHGPAGAGFFQRPSGPTTA